MTNTDAVMFNRIHHQLSPNQLRYQCKWNHTEDRFSKVFLAGDKNDEEWRKLIQDLHEKRGHELGADIGNATPVIQSIYILPDGTIEAVSDYRHKGIPDGHWINVVYSQDLLISCFNKLNCLILVETCNMLTALGIHWSPTDTGSRL